MGWETLVLSFGSGFRYEMTPDDPYIQTVKTNVAKASAMGIECGGYDLTVLDRGHNGYVSRTIIAGDLGCILPLAGCFLALGSGLRLVGTASARR